MHGGTATGDRDFGANDDEDGDNIIKVGDLSVVTDIHFYSWSKSIWTM